MIGLLHGPPFPQVFLPPEGSTPEPESHAFFIEISCAVVASHPKSETEHVGLWKTCKVVDLLKKSSSIPPHVRTIL